MKALSLLQPWASLVVMGIKKMETRSWATGYRGDLLIHASGGKAGMLFSENSLIKRYIPDFNALPFGAIIGKVILADVIPMEQLGLFGDAMERLTVEQKAFGDYSAGRYAWVLEHPEVFQVPVPRKGAIRLWETQL